jgi:hypothetical protein
MTEMQFTQTRSRTIFKKIGVAFCKSTPLKWTNMTRNHMPHPRFDVCLCAIAVILGTTAMADTLTGGFSGTAGVERVERVASLLPPVWREGAGFRLVVSGTFTQTENGEGSVVIRLLDDEKPLTLTWHSATGFQLVAPGGLPLNTPASSNPSEPQMVTWRLRIHSLQSPEKRLVLETQQPDGGWLVVMERRMVLNGIREWIGDGDGGVLTVGIAGPVALGEDTRVEISREGTLILLK